MSSSTTPEKAANCTSSRAGDDKVARRKRFEDVFPIIADELLGYVKGEGMPNDAVGWYEKVRSYASLLAPSHFRGVPVERWQR